MKINSYYGIDAVKNNVTVSELNKNKADAKESKTVLNVGSKIADKIKAIKDNEYTNNIMSKNKKSVNGALVGGGIGLLLGFYKSQNLFLYTSVGALSGILIANVFNSKSK